MTASKATGTRWETAIREHLRGMDYDVESLRTVGREDQGDLVVKEDGGICVIEAKATQRLDLSGFVNQALVERDHYAKARGLDPKKVLPVVVVKRRNKSVADAFVVTTVAEFFA